MLAKTPQHELIDRTALDQWRKTLLDGADFLEAHGLARHRLCDHDGSVCARGAMAQLTPRLVYSNAWIDRVAVMMQADAHHEAFLGLRSNGVPDWSNAPSRTAADVITAMRQCAMEGLGSN